MSDLPALMCVCVCCEWIGVRSFCVDACQIMEGCQIILYGWMSYRHTLMCVRPSCVCVLVSDFPVLMGARFSCMDGCQIIFMIGCQT